MGGTDPGQAPAPARRAIARTLRALNATPPSAMGTPFEKE